MTCRLWVIETVKGRGGLWDPFEGGEEEGESGIGGFSADVVNSRASPACTFGWSLLVETWTHLRGDKCLNLLWQPRFGKRKKVYLLLLFFNFIYISPYSIWISFQSFLSTLRTTSWLRVGVREV